MRAFGDENALSDLVINSQLETVKLIPPIAQAPRSSTILTSS